MTQPPLADSEAGSRIFHSSLLPAVLYKCDNLDVATAVLLDNTQRALCKRNRLCLCVRRYDR